MLGESEFFQNNWSNKCIPLLPCLLFSSKKGNGGGKNCFEKAGFEKTEWNFRNSTLVPSVLSKL